jgi:hypothetical protein
MNYLSPFYILPPEFSEGREIDKKTLKQARKVLMAEFELQGQSTIFINEKEYDKDGILKFFEQLEKDANFEFHSFIFQNRLLLSFLENGDIESYQAASDVILEKKCGHDTAFISFIAPYFTAHYNKLLYQALRNNSQADLSQLLEKEFPLPPVYEAAAYQLSYRWFHQQLRKVEQTEQELLNEEFVSGTRIYELIEPLFILNFNRMSMYFFDIRDKYAFKLYEIVVLLNNEYKRTELARSVLDEGIKLNVEHRTHQYYVQADKIVESKQKTKKRYNWLIFYVIAQVLFFVIKLSTCNDSPSTSDYNFSIDAYQPEFNYTIPNDFDSVLNETTERNNKELEKNLIDLRSLIELLEKEIEKTKFDTVLISNEAEVPSDLSDDTSINKN